MAQLKILLQIMVNDKNQIMIAAPGDKKLCLNLLADAIKVLANQEEKKPLIQPANVIPIVGDN